MEVMFQMDGVVGVGNNWCNSCFCEDGVLSCTEMDCVETMIV